jgi:hypothetical protein
MRWCFDTGANFYPCSNFQAVCRIECPLCFSSPRLWQIRLGLPIPNTHKNISLPLLYIGWTNGLWVLSDAVSIVVVILRRMVFQDDRVMQTWRNWWKSDRWLFQGSLLSQHLPGEVEESQTTCQNNQYPGWESNRVPPAYVRSVTVRASFLCVKFLLKCCVVHILF